MVVTKLRKAIILLAILFVLVVALVLIFLPRNCNPKLKPVGHKPNVLMIVADDLNHWVHFLGRNNQSITPNLDRLAAMGQSFSQAYAAAPLCNPSRAAFMSGLRPSTSGVYGDNDDWRIVIPREQMMTNSFRKGGYELKGAGKIYHTSLRRYDEWDEYVLEKERHTQCEILNKTDTHKFGSITWSKLDCEDDALGDSLVADYAVKQLSMTHSKPLFLTIGFYKPHLPWLAPKKYYDMFPLESIQLPPHIANDIADVPKTGEEFAHEHDLHKKITEANAWKQAIQAYLAIMAYTDMNIGRVIDALNNGPLKNDTIVVLVGDHGFHLGEKEHWGKNTLWEEASRAPMIWSVPNMTQEGAKCNQSVDFMSIFPTLMELCGLPRPSHVEGASITKLLKNPTADWRIPAIHTRGFRNHAVRSNNWRYIHYKDNGRELYNEKLDPYEWNNLINNSALGSNNTYTEIVTKLSSFLPTINKKAKIRCSEC